MFRTPMSRRREAARVDAFVAAIRATAPGARPAVLELRTDTVQFPRIVLTAGAVLTAGLAVAAWLFPADVTPARTATPPTVVQQLTGTDAGLITTPAASGETQRQDRAAALGWGVAG